MIHDAKAMDLIVRQGSLQSSGMISFRDEVSALDLEAIRAYVIHRANEDKQNPVEYQNPAAPH